MRGHIWEYAAGHIWELLLVIYQNCCWLYVYSCWPFMGIVWKLLLPIHVNCMEIVVGNIWELYENCGCPYRKLLLVI